MLIRKVLWYYIQGMPLFSVNDRLRIPPFCSAITSRPATQGTRVAMMFLLRHPNVWIHIHCTMSCEMLFNACSMLHFLPGCSVVVLQRGFRFESCLIVCTQTHNGVAFLSFTVEHICLKIILSNAIFEQSSSRPWRMCVKSGGMI